MRKTDKMEKIVLVKRDCTGEEFVAMEGYFAGLIDCEFLDDLSYVQIGNSEYCDGICYDCGCCDCEDCDCEDYDCEDCDCEDCGCEDCDCVDCDCKDCDCKECDCVDCDCYGCKCECHCCELFEELGESLTQEDVLEELACVADVSIYEVEDFTGKTRFPNNYIVLPNVLLKEIGLDADELRIVTNNDKIEIFSDTF
ncbi:MAG: hypothetical protein R3Y53_09660 [Bacillota bacterium]